jgi:site-specific recombinase XerD
MAAPSINASARFHTLPRQFQEERKAFEVFCISMRMMDPKTVAEYCRFVELFMEWLFLEKGRATSLGVTASDCVEFITKYMAESNVSHGTVAVRRKALSSMMRWQFMEGHINAEEITRFLTIRVSKRSNSTYESPRALRKHEIRQVFATIDRRWTYDPKAMDAYARGMKTSVRLRKGLRQSLENVQRHTIILLALHTGMRKEEIYNLTVKDVDPKNRTIYILGKGGKWRHCLYTTELREQMTRFLAHRSIVVGHRHDKLWFSTHGDWGKHPSIRAFEKWIHYIFDHEIGAGWHILRKTFATTCYEMKMPISQISQLLGHADERTTQIYLDLGKDFVFNIADEYGDKLTNSFKPMIPPRPHERDYEDAS